MTVIPVRLSGVSYDIYLGEALLARAGALCREVNPQGERVLLVSDSHVAPLYAHTVMQSLTAAGYAVSLFVFPAGETGKCLETIAAMYEKLASAAFSRGDLLAALGGGVTGDVTGFAAATWLRGVDFVQIPTTLLAQVDASIGGKTGVDMPQGKNLVGAFHQPVRVIADVTALQTLPPAYLTDGMAEIIKAACIRDKALFAELEKGDALSPACLQERMAQAVRIKRDIVERDETEEGERKLLNFGHTLGHALERRYEYALPHGHAVALGMLLLTRASEKQGLTEQGTAARLEAVLYAYGLPTREETPLSAVVSYAATDKKRMGGYLDVVLLRRVGEGFLHRLPFAAFPAFLQGESL